MGGERLCLFCISFIMKNRRRVWIWGIYSLLPTHTQTGHINTTKNETYVKKSLCTDKKTWPGHAPEAPPFLLKSNISDVTTSSHVLTSRLADPRWALLIGIIWIWQENPGWQKQHPVFPLCPLPCNPPPPAVPALRLYFFSHQHFNISLWHTAFCFHWCLFPPHPVQTNSRAFRVRCAWCWGWRWRLWSSWKRSLIVWMPCWSAATPWQMLSARCAGTRIKSEMNPRSVIKAAQVFSARFTSNHTVSHHFLVIWFR